MPKLEAAERTLLFMKIWGSSARGGPMLDTSLDSPKMILLLSDGTKVDVF